MLDLTDLQKIGIGLTGFGVFFLFLGMLLFFDNSLLAMGNVLFLSGLSMLIGLQNTFLFFFQWHKAKGTALFFGGIFIVLIGWSFFGMIIEAVGTFYLFSGFLPVILNFLQRVPVIRSIFMIPAVKAFSDKATGRLPV